MGWVVQDEVQFISLHSVNGAYKHLGIRSWPSDAHDAQSVQIVRAIAKDLENTSIE